MPKRAETQHYEYEFEDLHSSSDKPDSLEIDLNDDEVNVAVLNDDDEPLDDLEDKGTTAAADDDDPVAAVKEELERERRLRTQNDTRHEQELQFIRQQLESKGRQGDDASDDDLDEKEKEIKEALRKAHEEGETDTVIEKTEELSDIRAERKIRKARDEYVQSTQPQQPPPNPKAQKWVQENDWFTDPAHTKEKQFAIAVDQELVAEGYDPDSDEYYEKLSERIGDAFPKLVKSKGKASKKPSRPPVGGVGRGGEGKPKKGKITLSKEDIETMETFNLDPKNPDHLREFALNKVG